ncbi:hypothetical protein A2U01_0017529, partial [Trifolium medium]|nr:hypothetical protein [Trifolium medium]
MRVTESNNVATNNERHLVVNEPENNNNIQLPIVTIPNADETPTDNSAEKIVTLMRFLKKTNAARLWILSSIMGMMLPRLFAPERQNDNDFNHSASEEVLEEEIAQ